MSDFSIETPDLVAPDGNGYYGSDAHVCDLQLAVEMNGKRVLELEAELSFYANCSYSSSWATGDKNHVMEDRGDRASNYLFGKAEPRKSCNTAIEALKDQS